MIALWLGWLTLFLIGTDLFVISPLLPRIAHAMAIPSSQLGWMVTVFALAYVIGGPRLGALADRVGRRVVLAVALAVFAAANALTALAPSYDMLLAARALAGFAASGVTPSVYGMIGTGAPSAKRATWLSIVTSGLLLALATGAPAGSLIAGLTGWRGVFLILCAAAGLVVTLNLLIGTRAPEGRAESRADPQRDADAPAVPLALRLRAVSVTGLWALAVYGVYTFLGSGLRDVSHLGGGAVALALVLYGAGALAGNLAGGPLADRFGGLHVTTISLLGLTFVEAALGFVVHARAVLLVALGLFALVAYPYFSAHQTRLITSYGNHAGALMAWNNTAMYVGILIASAAGGAILAHTSFSVLIELAAAIALLGALAARFAIPREQRSQRPQRCGAHRGHGPISSRHVKGVVSR
jgi:predicted MFS family arabinose efflux permease